MLNPSDIFDIRAEMREVGGDYRETFLVYVSLSSGSNYNAFSDGPINISSGSPGVLVPTFTTYRAKARIKIVHPMELLGLGPPIPGVEVGDYLLYFKLTDRQQVARVISEKRAYCYVDGTRLRPERIVETGLTRSDEVMVHCKKFEPEFKATGL